MSLDEDLSLTALGGGAYYEGRIDERYWTPRGPLGGYVMAFGLRGLELAVDDPARQPRSVTMHFLRPPGAGPILVRPTLERAGRSLTTASVRLEQDGKLLAIALGAFSGPWAGPLLDDAPMPEVEPAEDRSVSSGESPRENRPPFLDLLVMQSRFGKGPFSGAEHAETGGWLGLREERPIDAATLTILADAWFPAPWTRLRSLAPAPTIDLTVHFRAPLPLPDALILGRFQTSVVRDGFFEEDGELWAPDGTLLAQSRQLGLLLDAEV